MPQNILSLKKFIHGTLTNPDISDVPDEASVASANIDGDVIDGELRGVESHSTFGTFPNVYDGEFIYDDVNNKYDYVYFDKALSKLRVISDFYGTPVASDLASSITSATFVVRNRAVHVGIGRGSSSEPKWIGRITYGQFNNSAPSGLQTLGTTCLTPVIGDGSTSETITANGSAFIDQSSAGSPDASDYFQENTTYYYKVSFIYDTIQESPLSGLLTYLAQSGTSAEGITFEFRVYLNAGSINANGERISGINIYRAEGTYYSTIDPTTADPETSYRLVETIDINDSGWAYTDLGYPYYYITFTDTGTIGISYDNNTGMSETLQSTSVNYTLNAQTNGYHFVSGSYHASLDDAAFILFRSKKLRFDLFDWSNDLLHLPKVPTAMVSYAGRLYVFDEDNTYKINPDQMYIEDIFEGVGCQGPRGTEVTPFGVFIADSKGIYLIDGNRIVPISNAIKYSTLGDITGVGSYNTLYPGYYDSLKSTFSPILIFNSIKNYLMVNMYDSSGNLVTWAYHVFKKRWDYWTYNSLPVNGSSGFVTGKDGSVYLSNGSTMYKLFQTGSYTWIWISKRFDFGKLSQNKMINKIVFQGEPTTKKYGSDGSDPATTSITNDVYMNVYLDTIQLYLSGSSPCYGIDIIHRIMIGER